MVLSQNPWYSLYLSYADAAWLSNIILQHAAYAASTAVAARTIQGLLQCREMSQFEDARSAAADAAPRHEPPENKPLARDDTMDDADDDFASHLFACAHHVFGIPSLRPRQMEAATKIIFEKKCRGRLFVVDRTGGGLILHTVAMCVGGVSLVPIPLLALTADQLSRIKFASQCHI